MIDEYRALREALVEELHGGRPPRFFFLNLILRLLFGTGRRGLVYLLRSRDTLTRLGDHNLAALLDRTLQTRFGCHISRSAVIGPGLDTPHPVGIVIGKAVTLGVNCTVYQHVTLGVALAADDGTDRYPTVGQNVTLFAGAVVVGKVTIGDNAVIGANSVVLSDVPAGHLAVGAPARTRRIAPDTAHHA